MLIVWAILSLALKEIPTRHRIRMKHSRVETTIIIHVPLAGQVSVYHVQNPSGRRKFVAGVPDLWILIAFGFLF
jgi:hypothetical protein